MKISEAQFQRTVVETAELCGWHVMHVRKATERQGQKWVTPTSIKGWPDLVLYRDVTLYRELKSDTGRVTAEQRQVLTDLEDAGNDVGVWSPSDWKTIEATLRRPRHRAVTEGNGTAAVSPRPATRSNERQTS